MLTCAHLQPLEHALAEHEIDLAPTASPYSDDSTWFGCHCTFDEPALRSRLGLAACVVFVEYDGRVAGSDATFSCNECRCVILGLHPRYAPARTPRLR